MSKIMKHPKSLHIKAICSVLVCFALEGVHFSHFMAILSHFGIIIFDMTLKVFVIVIPKEGLAGNPSFGMTTTKILGSVFP